jgi:hypothetical protein
MILGEGNSGHNRDQYTCTFSKMIESWRAVWHMRTDSITDPTFPFGFVQVMRYLVIDFTSSDFSSLVINIYE